MPDRRSVMTHEPYVVLRGLLDWASALFGPSHTEVMQTVRLDPTWSLVTYPCPVRPSERRLANVLFAIRRFRSSSQSVDPFYRPSPLFVAVHCSQRSGGRIRTLPIYFRHLKGL